MLIRLRQACTGHLLEQKVDTKLTKLGIPISKSSNQTHKRKNNTPDGLIYAQKFVSNKRLGNISILKSFKSETL